MNEREDPRGHGEGGREGRGDSFALPSNLTPMPPSLSEAEAATRSPALDPVDALVLSQLEAPRLLQIGEKRIVRGRLPRGDDRRRDLERRLSGVPVDLFFERVGGETFATVSRPRSRALPAGWPLNALLFLLTLLTTTWAGAFWNGVDPFAGFSPASPDLALVTRGLSTGLPFALSLLAILTCHEFGHWFAARRYALETTLPYYIPIPPLLSPIGTLGAVIKMGTPLYNRRILMDVGAAGPLAGVAVALPILGWGILHAPLVPLSGGPGLYLNEPLLFTILEKILRPDIGPRADIVATPLVLAGWLGLFVTALNLLPVGQLDGGHVLYALLGKGQHRLGAVCLAAMAGLGFLWSGWWVWVAITLLVVRVKHPPVLDLDLPLDAQRKAIGWISVVLFALCVHPVPFEVR